MDIGLCRGHGPSSFHRAGRGRFGVAGIRIGLRGHFVSRAGGIRPSQDRGRRSGGATSARGKTMLGLGGTRDAILIMPAVIPATPLPLLVMLHGAGGSADRFLQRFGTLPNETGLPMLFVDSRGKTWDGIRGGFGPDVDFLDRALEEGIRHGQRRSETARARRLFRRRHLCAVARTRQRRPVPQNRGVLARLPLQTARRTENRGYSSHTALPTRFCRSIGAAG